MKKQMTMQEAFTKAYLGLKRQGFKRSHKGNTCRYVGPDGLRCAIGHLVTKKEGIIGDRAVFPSVREQLNAGNFKRLDDLELDFLEELQRAHDAAEDAEDVRSNLKAVAVAFGLEVPK